MRSIIEEIAASSFGNIVLIVKNQGVETRMSAPRRLVHNRKGLLYALYTKLDNRFSRVESDAFEQTDISALCESIDVIGVSPVMTKFRDALTDADCDAIAARQVDVFLRFGFRILHGRVLNVARYGIWSYHHGDSHVHRGSTPGFWEVMNDDDVTGSMLQVLTEDLDNGRVIYRSWAPTINRFSVKKNLNNYYWKTARFVGRKLAELHRDRAAWAAEAPPDPTPQPYSARLYMTPTNGEMVRVFASLGLRAVRRIFDKLAYTEGWAVAYRFGARNEFPNAALYRFKYLVPPSGSIWADPFPVHVDGKYFVFFEDLIESKGIASIAAIELRKDGTHGEPITVLERPYHLSYPFMFEWQGAQYMIPETGGNNAVEIYKCTSFPDVWEKQATLLEANDPCDATIFEHDGRWWMFVNISAPNVTVNWEELHLYSADSPLGPWIPHAQNPVKSDVRNSRPAGKVFRYEGQLMRPAQDSSRRYGYATVINRIETLTMHEFREEPVAHILPEWDSQVVGTHTLNSVDGLTVIDCVLKRRRLFA